MCSVVVGGSRSAVLDKTPEVDGIRSSSDEKEAVQQGEIIRGGAESSSKVSHADPDTSLDQPPA
jgi:hypothetical protein